MSAEQISTLENLETAIEGAWDARDELNANTKGERRDAVEEALNMLDSGKARVAEKIDGNWQVHQWLKKAVLLSFRLNPMAIISGGPDGAPWYDKVDSKFKGWDQAAFDAAGFRAVPNCTVRRSAFIGKGVVLMPSFVNIGAYVDEGTMVDTWATVGSGPTIIEDNCFIGARSEVVEGVVVEEGAVLSMGVFISASTKIIDRNTGEIFVGRVPAYSVVVPGTMPGKPLPDGSPGPNLACAVIVKRVDEKTRSKTSINELLRDI